jgi:NAD(P)-dependent dehydrogenase (short-subunit alcohol dehydrogenase family)
MPEEGSLEGRVALVTGGASGIGRAVTARLVAQRCRVVIADVDLHAGDTAARELGATFVPTDVGEPDQVAAAVDAAITTYGRLDVAHLNAGVATGESDVTRLSPADYRHAVRVNVDGVVFGTQAAAARMERGGAIVATASLAGLVAYPGDPIYGLTKHAVVGFVRAVATQLAARGLTINALCPGFVDTPIIGPFADEFRTRGFPLLDPADVADAVISIVLSQRNGEVFVCQPGRLCEAYEFRGVPGPRVPGARGMAPPLQPGA